MGTDLPILLIILTVHEKTVASHKKFNNHHPPLNSP